MHVLYFSLDLRRLPLWSFLCRFFASFLKRNQGSLAINSDVDLLLSSFWIALGQVAHLPIQPPVRASQIGKSVPPSFVMDGIDKAPAHAKKTAASAAAVFPSANFQLLLNHSSRI